MANFVEEVDFNEIQRIEVSNRSLVSGNQPI